MAFKKEKPEGKKGLDEWMGTYGDMITLMLCFFVILYSMSSIEEEKFIALAESYAGRPTILSGSVGSIIADQNIGFQPDYNAKEASDEVDEDAKKAAEEALKQKELLDKMASDFKTYLSQNDATSQIAVDVLGDYMLITFPGGMLFDSGKAFLRPSALETLDYVSNELIQYADHFIRVEGHTDTVPMNTSQYPSNRHLSSARADTVVEYLVNSKGFNPKMLSSEGMSEYWPIDSNDTPEGRANNRRVEIKVYAPQAESGWAIPMD